MLIDMKENNIIQEKSFAFALQIVSLYKTIVSEKKEFVLSKQLLRSGTSIGANIEEAIGGYSEKDFAHKLSISYKETRETIYWLKLLYQSEYISKEEFDRAHLAAEEIARILGKIQITLKNRNS
jgi:four helix bundle protein